METLYEDLHVFVFISLNIYQAKCVSNKTFKEKLNTPYVFSP
jgi:hypothetical protein